MKNEQNVSSQERYHLATLNALHARAGFKTSFDVILRHALS
jgi:hypothetical protein